MLKLDMSNSEALSKPETIVSSDNIFKKEIIKYRYFTKIFY